MQTNQHDHRRDCISGVMLLGIFALISVFSGCSAQRAPVTYAAETSVSGYTIRVELTHDHPFLAEYKKVVSVRKGNTPLVSKEYYDTGGLANFYLLQSDAVITIVDGATNGFTLDTQTGAVGEIDRDNLPEDFCYQSFGQFMFDGTYKWVLKEHLPPWAQHQPAKRPDAPPEFQLSAASLSQAARDPRLIDKYLLKIVEVEGVTCSVKEVAYEKRPRIALSGRATDALFQGGDIGCIPAYTERDHFKTIPLGRKAKIVGRVISMGPQGCMLENCVEHAP